MDRNFMFFLVFVFVGMTLLAYVMGGAFFGSADVAYLNNLTVIRVFKIMDTFPVPVINLDFFTAFIKLVQMDYPYFGGAYQLVRFGLYTFSVAAMFMLFILGLGVVYSFVRR